MCFLPLRPLVQSTSQAASEAPAIRRQSRADPLGGCIREDSFRLDMNITRKVPRVFTSPSNTRIPYLSSCSMDTQRLSHAITRPYIPLDSSDVMGFYINGTYTSSHHPSANYPYSKINKVLIVERVWRIWGFNQWFRKGITVNGR